MRRRAWVALITGLTVTLVLLSSLFVVFNDKAHRRWEKLRHGWLPAMVEWESAPAGNAGLNALVLEELRDDLASRGTSSLLIVRHGRIVYEWYAPQAAVDEGLGTASLAKSLAGGMALLVALSDGHLNLDDPVSQYLPGWADDPLRSKVTVRHLATHTSGLEDAKEPGVAHRDLRGWKGDFWSRDSNPFRLVLENARPHFRPGSAFSYSSTGFAALGYAITASLRGTVDDGIRGLLRRRIMEPIGVPRGAWSMGYYAEYEHDGLRLHPVWGGGSYTSRAAARVGQLMLNKGRWNGQVLVDSEWVDAVTSYYGTPLPDRSEDPAHPATAAAWFTNFDGVWPSVPTDAFAGAGKGHQILLVVPSLELVVVRFGSRLDRGQPRQGFWEAADAYLFQPLMDALLTSPMRKTAASARVYSPTSGAERVTASDLIR